MSETKWRWEDRVFEEDKIFVFQDNITDEPQVMVNANAGHEAKAEEIARRVAAALNSVAGIPTEALERGALRAFLAVASAHGRLPTVVEAVLLQLHLPEDYDNRPREGGRKP